MSELSMGMAIGVVLFVLFFAWAIVHSFRDALRQLQQQLRARKNYHPKAAEFGFAAATMPDSTGRTWHSLLTAIGVLACILAIWNLIVGQIPQTILFALTALLAFNLMPWRLQKPASMAAGALALYVGSSAAMAEVGCFDKAMRSNDFAGFFGSMDRIAQKTAAVPVGILTGVFVGHLNIFGEAASGGPAKVFRPFALLPDFSCSRRY